jgi:hypothetical protein
MTFDDVHILFHLRLVLESRLLATTLAGRPALVVAQMRLLANQIVKDQTGRPGLSTQARSASSLPLLYSPAISASLTSLTLFVVSACRT